MDSDNGLLSASDETAIALTAAACFEPEPLFRLLENLDLWVGQSPTPTLARKVGVKDEALCEASSLARRASELAGRECERVAAAGARILLRSDAAYPRALADLERPPFVLYSRGEIPTGPGLAIVGPRRPDPWALEATRLFARRFSEAGLVVVSGFARGVDRVAHESALSADGGLTVAVLGCGLSIDYPRGQRRLHQAISRRGAMITEFTLDAEPRPHFFPVRNRLIAALGWGTLVIQAAERSGSLVTARLALDLGREVMALPGRIFDRRSRGTNLLIRDGARCVLDPDEVLESLPLAIQDALAKPKTPAATPGVPEGSGGRLLGALADTSDPWTAEQAAGRLALPVSEVLAALAELEIGGRVRRLPGARYLVTAGSIQGFGSSRDH